MLENIQENAFNLLSSTRFWMILIVLLVFITTAVYVYSKYVTPLIEPKYSISDQQPRSINFFQFVHS